MSVHEKMTAIADAIRGKTGETEAMTLDQMAAAIAGIETGGGSGGNGEFSYVSEHHAVSTTVVTIGANTVTNIDAVWKFLSGLIEETLCTAILLADAPTVENQFLARYSAESQGFVRWKNGLYQNVASMSSAYDAKLAEGSQYLLIGLTRWA